MTMIDELTYENAASSIFREIEHYPLKLGIIEAVRNCLQAKNNTAIEFIPIIWPEYEKDEVASSPKLGLWNDGIGMDHNELYDHTNWASSGKTLGINAGDCYGRGEKAATLRYNRHQGIIWMSCKNGRVCLTKLIGIGDKYGRNSYYERGGDDITGKSTVLDITDAVLFRGEDNIVIGSTMLNNGGLQQQYPNLFSTKRDWTLKVYLGDRATQNTCRSPFDNNPDVSDRWIIQALEKRFFIIPDGITIKLHKNTTHKAFNSKIYNTTHECFVNHTIKNHPDYAFYKVVTDKTNPGIKIHYYLDPLSSEVPNLSNNPGLQGHRISYMSKSSKISEQFCGIVYRNEITNFLGSSGQGHDHQRLFRELGVYKNSIQFKIMIELDTTYDNIIRPDSDRTKMVWKNTNDSSLDDTEVKVEYFIPEIIDNMPQKFKDKIENQRIKNLDTSDLNKQLAKFMKTLISLGRTGQPGAPGNTTGNSSGNNGGPGKGNGGPSGNSGNSTGKSRKGTGAGNGNGNGNSNGKRKRIKNHWHQNPGNGIKAPKIELVFDEQIITDIGLDGFVGIYSEHIKEILVNAKYEMCQSWIKDAYAPYVTRPYADDMYSFIETEILNTFALTVGEAVCRALAKQANGKWNDSNIRQAYDKCSLSIAADSVRQDYEEIARKNIKRYDKNLATTIIVKSPTKPVVATKAVA